MYVPPVFKTEAAKAWAFVESRGFGTITAVGEDGFPIAAHLPFLVVHAEDSARIEAHVARANPLHACLDSRPSVLVGVLGPDAYISPDWYVKKDQVPTWNYVAVQLKGRARLLPEAETLAHVDRLSDAFERRLSPKPVWRSAKLPAAKRAAMLKAIVAFEIEIVSLEASWKLAQHKTLGDRIEVARMLAGRGGSGETGIAELMAASLAR